MLPAEAPILSNITNKLALSHKQSRLDLLDDTILTSLPLPPPLKRKNTDRDVDTDDVGNTTAEDPIILIEDYVPTTVKPRLNKKKSLAIFKSKFNKRLKVTNSLSDLFVSAMASDGLKHCDLCEKPLYELSSFIGSENIKTKKFHEFICGECVETYEQFFNLLEDENSDFIASANTTLSIEENEAAVETVNFSPELQMSDFTKNLEENHHHEIRSDSVESNESSKSKNSILLQIFQSINQKYEVNGEVEGETLALIPEKASSLASDPRTAPLKRKFSDGLLHQLNVLNKLSEPNKANISWLNSFREKFRNWRFNNGKV